MSPKLRAWLLLTVVAAVCTVALGSAWWLRARNARPAALLRRLPTRESIVVSIDFAALRRAGILQMLAPKTGEEPEYRTFVQRTGFNYQRDLDSVLIAFTAHAKYFLLRGRFDWNALRAYTQAENGACQNSLCRLAGSAPDRRISFFAVQPGVMALASGIDPYAALALGSGGAPAPFAMPEAPLWISIPQMVLRSGNGLPAGTRMFARGLEGAQGAIISIDRDGERFAARLDVRCRSAEEAAAVAQQLTKTTALLRDLILREHHQPNPADFSGVLSSGSFHNDGARVVGTWPIERSFIDNLLAGAG